MNKDSRILLAGENSLEGKALIRLLQQKGFSNIANLQHPEPELADYGVVETYFKEKCPEYVFLFAGKSGGIKANQEMPATLMQDNLRVINNIMSLSHEYEVKKLLYLASSCVYPKYSDQPMCPDMLMTGFLEPTNSAYATAKLAGIELCRAYRKEHGDDFISAIPANVFGPGDDFSVENSHVMAALIRKMYGAKLNNEKTVEIWGTGKPKREFIFVDDLVDACIFLMEQYNHYDPVNVGSGTILSVYDLAEAIKKVTGYGGQLRFNRSKPDGMPEKTLDSSHLRSMGWKPSSSFEISMERTCRSFNAEQLSLTD